ncbi:uncharacterized protein BYT42DRAFT_545216 [Radiomyces spectabilis]|uniref:uncharacterized protein n=1 Tax=Radiomyces spectabilis TaxID=64574 RepID=UPI00221FDD51|nr:uncharacterized protein BYT42DRAFT_545216 [Radiomyces spectabilis]KAI8381303.1 hypothetical protein BYT42DRAFT_545216 [Radiomyces spectabilis]
MNVKNQAHIARPFSTHARPFDRPTASSRKRTHLKPHQLKILLESFADNELPDADIRYRLAQTLGVSTRTVQIWFQNRRAKKRKLEARPTTASGGVQPPTQEAVNSSTTVAHKPIAPSILSNYSPPSDLQHLPTAHLQPVLQAMPLPTPGLNSQENQFALPMSNATTMGQSSGMLVIPAQMLRIGSWIRFAHGLPEAAYQWHLFCYGDASERQFIWQVVSNNNHFRIHMKFEAIKELRLSQQWQPETGSMVGQLDMDLVEPYLAFSMWRIGIDHQWVRCGDFTEDKQATSSKLHTLQGNHEAFKQALLELIAQAPELACKIVIAPSLTPSSLTASMTPPLMTSPPPLDFGRDFTLSPSATPEVCDLQTYSNQLLQADWSYWKMTSGFV